ncbi:hypothetical protein UZ36_06120 [Candidatus Nitromaritima sp. SCGC AAA799-C22]|nr:hypothetical protein UZ36_06120 [Candidatus Nitromaritima sp. SCGC AAA799-C22]
MFPVRKPISIPVLATLLAIYLVSGCASRTPSPEGKFDRLPPIPAAKQEKPSIQQPVKAGKIQRRVYRIANNDFDIKILPSKRLTKNLSAKNAPQTGFAVHFADVNGDSRDDLIIGAPFPEGILKDRDAREEAYVIFGKNRLPRTIDLSQADVVFYRRGAVHSSRFGQAIATGDVNGDGIKDMIFGAPHSSGKNKIFRAGQVYVVYGRKKLAGAWDITKNADLTISGSETSSETGFAVASGDINGDGLSDLILGSPGTNRENEVMAGQVQVIFGRKNMPRNLSLAHSWDMRLMGIDGSINFFREFGSAPDRAGSALAIGDINGDGADDILIGAPFANGPENSRSGAGETYVVYGSKKPKRSIDLATEASATLWGAIKGSHAGFSLAAGDVNGDGKDDIVIGTGDPVFNRNKNWQVGAYLVFGRKRLPLQIDLRQNVDRVFKDNRKKEPPKLIPGKTKVDSFRGYSVNLGDLNGDDLSDLLVGTPLNAENRGQAAYAISGGKGSSKVVNLSEHFDRLILQPVREDFSNHTVAVGDINGDGFQDIVVSASENDRGKILAGKLFLILGRP